MISQQNRGPSARKRRTSPLNRTSVVGAVLASKFGVAHRLLALGPVSHFNRGGGESMLHFGEFERGESSVVGDAGERLVEAGAQLQPSALTTSVLRNGCSRYFAGGPAASSPVNNQSELGQMRRNWHTAVAASNTAQRYSLARSSEQTPRRNRHSTDGGGR
jgi:hypothetical protein